MFKFPYFIVDIIKMFGAPGKTVLEIGCGPAFLRNVFCKDYLGVDISCMPYRHDLPRSVDIVCSAEQLSLDIDSIDIIIIKSAFYLFQNHKACLQEALRVLKHNGKIIIFDYNRRTQKILQKKEGHSRYPCWTQWGLKKLVVQHGFTEVRNLLAANEQSYGLRQFYQLLRQEHRGDWAIVCGTKA